MTREQVETEMAQYRTIFTVVRLLDAAQVGGEESVNSFCSCYRLLAKTPPPELHLPAGAGGSPPAHQAGIHGQRGLSGHRRLPRGRRRSCVMELVQKLDGETLIDPENSNRLIDSVAATTSSSTTMP